MTFWDRLKAHRAALASVVSGTAVAAVVAVVAIVSSGYTAQRLDLGDGSVWVANNQDQAIGRANPQVLELNSVVETNGTDLDVLQSGATVLLVDRAENSLDIIDPATSTVSETVALPPDRPEVFLAGDRVVVHERGTGEVWIVPLPGLRDLRRRVGGDPELRSRRHRHGRSGRDAVGVFAVVPDRVPGAGRGLR